VLPGAEARQTVETLSEGVFLSLCFLFCKMSLVTTAVFPKSHLSDFFLVPFFSLPSFRLHRRRQFGPPLGPHRLRRRLPQAAAAAAAAAARPAGDSLLVEEEEEEEEQKELEPGEVETSAALQCRRHSRSACAGY
jgi:hypothetical protein